MPDDPRPDDRSAAPAPDPEPAEPAVEPAAAEPTSEPAATPSTPWDSDLAQHFEDPAQQRAVSEFLRATVQPYVTKIEQESAPDRHAQKLWDDFTNQPAETFMAVAQEIFGDERAEELRRVLVDEGGTPPVSEEYDVQLDELPPEVRQAVEFTQAQKRQEAWNDALKQIQDDNPDIKIKEELFAPFVNATDGNLDTAVKAYRSHIESFAEEYGFERKPAEEAVETEDAPAVIGAATRAPSAPPVETMPETIEDAIDELWDEMNEKKNAPVTL